MILAAPKQRAEGGARAISHAEVVRVATKFPNTARRYFESLGRQAEIIELHGSLELAPLVGLSECIVDLTATGTTLRENDLVVLDEISRSTARLIANRGAYRLRHERSPSCSTPCGGASMVKIIDARKMGSEEVVAQLRRPGGFLSPEVRAPPAASGRRQERGDEALAEYTERFDGVRPERFRIPGKEIERSRASLPSELEGSFWPPSRTCALSEREMDRSWEMSRDGATVGQRVRPLRRLASTYRAGTQPTRAHDDGGYTRSGRGSAGDLRLRASWLRRSGEPVGARRSGAARARRGIRRRGAGGGGDGVRHETIPPVDKIVGPGNDYVTAAKLEVYGAVGVDAPRGPSEVVVIADASASPRWSPATSWPRQSTYREPRRYCPPRAPNSLRASRRFSGEASRSRHRGPRARPFQAVEISNLYALSTRT